VFAVKYRSNNDDAQGICRDTATCSPDEIERHRQLTNDARASRTGAFVSFGIGGAALIGAVATYFGIPLYEKEGSVVMSARPAYGLDGTWGFAAEGHF
jgi:hypothetical protein